MATGDVKILKVNAGGSLDESVLAKTDIENVLTGPISTHSHAAYLDLITNQTIQGLKTVGARTTGGGLLTRDGLVFGNSQLRDAKLTSLNPNQLFNIDLKPGFTISSSPSNVVVANNPNVLFDGNMGTAITLIPSVINAGTPWVLEVTNAAMFLDLCYYNASFAFFEHEGYVAPNATGNCMFTSWKLEIQSTADSLWYTLVDRTGVTDYVNNLNVSGFTSASPFYTNGGRQGKGFRLTIRGCTNYGTGYDTLYLAGINYYSSYATASGDYISTRGGTCYGNLTAPALVSIIATGTAPLQVASTTIVPNLNVQYLNGQAGTYYARYQGVVCTDGSVVTGNNFLTVPTPSRSVDNAPNTFKRGLSLDFKAQAWSGQSSYQGLITIAPYSGLSSDSAGYNTQLSVPAGTGGSAPTTNMFIRSGTDTTWGSWYKMLHTGNFAAGTDYLPMTGGTITGQIIVNDTVGNCPVYGTSINAQGVYGQSTNSVGVEGNSINNAGVYGHSQNGWAISGYSTDGHAIVGSSVNGYALSSKTINATAAYVRQEGVLTSSNVSDVAYIQRISSGNYSSLGNMLTIEDNPTVTGTIGGALICGIIGTTERLRFDPRVVNGSTAVAHCLDTHNTLSTAGAKLLSLRNAGTEKFAVGHDGGVTAGTMKLTTMKTTTGDGTGEEGLFQINTYDKTLKIYVGSAWRLIASW